MNKSISILSIKTTENKALDMVSVFFGTLLLFPFQKIVFVMVNTSIEHAIALKLNSSNFVQYYRFYGFHDNSSIIRSTLMLNVVSRKL